MQHHLFYLKNVIYEAGARPLLRLMLFKIDKFSHPVLCLMLRRNTPFSRIIIAIRKWTCANYFKRTTMIDRFCTDIFGIFGPYNL